ncbi:MAG: hypothetical protein AAF685_07550 [Cyanobacteria bacterium P01_C01_bin.89]
MTEWYWLGIGAIALTLYFIWSAATEMGTKPINMEQWKAKWWRKGK